MIGAFRGGKATWALSPDQRRQHWIAPEQDPARTDVVIGGHAPTIITKDPASAGIARPSRPGLLDLSRGLEFGDVAATGVPGFTRLFLLSAPAMAGESAFAPGVAGLLAGPLVRRAFLVGGFPALTCNLALPRAIHRCEASIFLGHDAPL